MFFPESYEIAMHYFNVNVNQHDDFGELTEEDIERIQEILDESDDEYHFEEDDDDEEIQILLGDQDTFPMPKKSTNNNSN